MIKLNKILPIVALFLSQPLKLGFYRRFLGWQIGNEVNIGFSYLESEEVIIGDGVKLGHFNIVRNLKLLKIEKDARIANFNQFYGDRRKREQVGWNRELVMEERVRFMSHHFVDVSGTVRIGANTTIGGRDTHFWSHGRLYNDGAFKFGAINIKIGTNSYVGARATLIGCDLPDGVIVGAGSIVNKSFAHDDSCSFLIAGNPAQIKKRYPRQKSSLELTKTEN
ncbi:MAG: hypothetical protein AAFY63_01035 [Cyanobacteria bacterium J06643_13]